MEENKDLSLIEKMLGNDGFKFVVTANLAPENYMKLGLTIVGSIFVGYSLILITKKIVGVK